MLEESEARRRILDAIADGGSEKLPLAEAGSRVAAADVFATVPLPGFDNSQMDGYAVRAADATLQAELTVIGEQPAGPNSQQPPLRVKSGQAVRIFTGAPIPDGADAVVMQEDVEKLGKNRIRIQSAAKPGEFVRRQGSDLCAGQKILAQREILTAARIGVLASQGLCEVRVGRRPRCAVVTTGDELTEPEPGRELAPGTIFNSNGPMLAQLASQFGAGEVTTFHAPDQPERLRAVLDRALENSDVCLVAGGVSVGEHDHVKAQLAALGVEGGFWRVRVKPGKPLFFGRRDAQIALGLPGNPVSVYITFLLFGVSVLAKWQGQIATAESPHLPKITAKLTENVTNNRGDRPHYIRGRLDLEEAVFRPFGLQQSHALFALSHTNALIRVEPGETLSRGESTLCYLTDLPS